MILPAHVSSGQLDRVIVLQRLVTPSLKNALGEEIETWADLAPPMYAGRFEDNGTSQTRGGEPAAQLSVYFMIRYTWFSPAINPRDRLIFVEDGLPPERGTIFKIEAIQLIGRREGHWITGSARPDQGV